MIITVGSAVNTYPTAHNNTIKERIFITNNLI